MKKTWLKGSRVMLVAAGVLLQTPAVALADRAGTRRGEVLKQILWIAVFALAFMVAATPAAA